MVSGRFGSSASRLSASRQIIHDSVLCTPGTAHHMTIPEEPTPIDPPEPEVTEVPETTGPVEVPEPAVTDTPERA